MKLISRAFKNGELIPVEYTCQGADLSPPLKFLEVPKGAEYLALTCIDPDAPSGEFIHWLVFNIPADTDSIEAGCKPQGIEVENDFGQRKYGGPCPPSGRHRYLFSLYALKTKLKRLTKENFVKEVESRAVEKAVLTGLYQKR